MKTWILPFLVIFIWGCSQNTNHLPEQFQDLDNLTVYSADAVPKETISFHKDAVYGDTEEVLFGEIGEVAVDSLERVFISDVEKKAIQAFEADGRYIGQMGREGSGPGEFSSYVKNLQIHNNRLYALDPTPNKLNVFSLDNLENKSELILAGNRNNYKILAKAYPGIRSLYVRSDNTYIAEFTMNTPYTDIQFYQNVEGQGLFYLLNTTGRISKGLLQFTREIRTNLGILINLPDYFGTTLTGFLNDDRIVLAEPDYFLVKTYSPDGDYQHAFFYPIRRFPLPQESIEEFELPDGYDITNVNFPETWPVLHTMIIDDQNRIWLATTVEDRNVFEWWVLENTGELITRFEWPRVETPGRAIDGTSIELVQNGYMYTRETDEETGLQQVVRYQIALEES